ncbi:MAG: hypothetical protein RIB59_09595 [Rhodospirillales bacterium]
MDTAAALLVLTSAALHPLRDFIAKGSEYRESFYLGIAAAWIVMTVPHALIGHGSLAIPAAAWPMVVFSALGLVLYYVGISISLNQGELSIYYPIIRSSPLFVAAANAVLFGQTYGVVIIAGIALTVVGAFAIQYRPGAGLLDKPPMFALAAMAMTGHAILTLADAKAMEITDPAPFLFWTYGLVFVTQLSWFVYTKPKARRMARHLFADWRHVPIRIVLAGALSYLSYILILLAFQRGGEAAAVAAVRQISIPVSVILGALILKEGMFGKRFVWSFALAAGVAVILAS